VVTAFRKELPEITVSAYSHHYAEAISCVLRQEVDMAIAFNPEEHPALVIEHFATAQFVGCFPARMRRTLPPVVELAEFQCYPFIALSSRDPLGSGIKAAIDLGGFNLPTSMEVNTNSLALALVEHGAGAAIVDEYTAAHFGANVAIRKLAPALTFEVGLVTLGNAAASNSLKRLRQLLFRTHEASHRVAEAEKM
jgi:DNA-binding transcriptional LysR family regulator